MMQPDAVHEIVNNKMCTSNQTDLCLYKMSRINQLAETREA
jgi:hypothetical protein